MPGYLLDTSVLSALAPDRPTLASDRADWFRGHGDELYLSAVTVAEIERGIRKLRRLGGRARADRLDRWLDQVLQRTGDRVLAFDAKAARIAGAMADSALAAGRHPGFADVAIGATAMANDLTLLTRNGRYFEPLGVAFIDPFDSPPAV